VEHEKTFNDHSSEFDMEQCELFKYY